MSEPTFPVELPLRPMLAKSVSGLPQPADFDGGLAYEPKWDGFRCIVLRDGEYIELASRGERPLTRYFPELAAALLRELPRRCIVDGEIVVRKGQRLDFDALTERIHPAATRINQLAERTPASFIAFDLLAVDGQALLAEPFRRRRDVLAEVLRDSKPPVHLTPVTLSPEVADRWFREFEGAGLDGVIAKPLTGVYEPGKRVMFKIKHERTADCVVAGFRWHKSGEGVGSLLLGLYDDAGRLHHMGVAASFTAKYRVELVEKLEPFRMTDISGHPWARWADPETGAEPPAPGEAVPGGLAAPTAAAAGRMPGGQSRWTGTRDLAWEPLRPELVVEVAYDHLQSGRFRHTGHMRRWRPDREPRSCTLSQLNEPEAYDLDQIFGPSAIGGSGPWGSGGAPREGTAPASTASPGAGTAAGLRIPPDKHRVPLG
jgi:ATP-dependent DNA ligase